MPGILGTILDLLDQVDDFVPGDVTCNRCLKPFDHKEIKRGLCEACRDKENPNGPR